MEKPQVDGRIVFYIDGSYGFSIEAGGFWSTGRG